MRATYHRSGSGSAASPSGKRLEVSAVRGQELAQEEGRPQQERMEVGRYRPSWECPSRLHLLLPLPRRHRRSRLFNRTTDGEKDDTKQSFESQRGIATSKDGLG
jgi:hypothetical protein